MIKEMGKGADFHAISNGWLIVVQNDKRNDSGPVDRGADKKH